MNLKTSSDSITMNNCVSSYEFYQQYHTHYFNKICHFVSIPMIIVCTMTFLRDIMVSKLPFNYVSLNRVIMVGYLLYYMSYGWWVGVLMGCYFEVLYRVASRLKMRMWVAIGVFCLAWMVQFIGHYVEGKRPAMMDSVGQAFLAAPLFAVSDVLMMVW